MHLLLTLTIIIIIGLGFLFYFINLRRAAAIIGQGQTADGFTGELNDFIEEYNQKYNCNIPYVTSDMKHVAALYELSKKHGAGARELLFKLTGFNIDNCAFKCQNDENCVSCCNENCKDSSEFVNCLQHCKTTNCSQMCTDSKDYIGCRRCCSRTCNINDYDGQMKCIKMCDANYVKEYDNCADGCGETTSSMNSCLDCCSKSCDGSDAGLCSARCSQSMIRFILNSHALD